MSAAGASAPQSHSHPGGTEIKTGILNASIAISVTSYLGCEFSDFNLSLAGFDVTAVQEQQKQCQQPRGSDGMPRYSKIV